MKILVNNYGANVNVIDWNENTPAILATMHKHTNSLNILLSSSSSSPLPPV
jgi:ankyrin repeat protein